MRKLSVMREYVEGGCKLTLPEWPGANSLQGICQESWKIPGTRPRKLLQVAEVGEPALFNGRDPGTVMPASFSPREMLIASTGSVSEIWFRAMFY